MAGIGGGTLGSGGGRERIGIGSCGVGGTLDRGESSDAGRVYGEVYNDDEKVRPAQQLPFNAVRLQSKRPA